MQILHPFTGSIREYSDAISDPGHHRPDSCPQCEARHALTGHGFYSRTLVNRGFDGIIRVRSGPGPAAGGFIGQATGRTKVFELFREYPQGSYWNSAESARQFRREVALAATEAGVRLSLETDGQTRTAPTGRVGWLRNTGGGITEGIKA